MLFCLLSLILVIKQKRRRCGRRIWLALAAIFPSFGSEVRRRGRGISRQAPRKYHQCSAADLLQ